LISDLHEARGATAHSIRNSFSTTTPVLAPARPTRARGTQEGNCLSATSAKIATSLAEAAPRHHVPNRILDLPNRRSLLDMNLWRRVTHEFVASVALVASSR
jgi:hypothetical protein